MFFSDHTDCGFPEQPLGGIVSIDGGVAHYSCKEGLVLIGGDSQYCGLDGLWGGATPVCIGEWATNTRITDLSIFQHHPFSKHPCHSHNILKQIYQAGNVLTLCLLVVEM